MPFAKNPLKEACNDFLERLKASDGAGAASGSDALVTSAVEALQLALKTLSPKLCEPALDALHKLVAAGLLKVRPGRYCSPRHQTRFKPSFLELNGIL